MGVCLYDIDLVRRRETPLALRETRRSPGRIERWIRASRRPPVFFFVGSLVKDHCLFE